MKQLLSISLLLLLSLNSVVQAKESRIDALITQDANDRLDEIVEKEIEIRKVQSSITELELDLAKQEKALVYDESATKTGIQIVTASAITIVVAFGTYAVEKSLLKVDPLKFIYPATAGTLGLAAGSLTTFNFAMGASNLRTNIAKTKTNIEILKKQLNNEKQVLCKIEPRHKGCY